MSYGYVPQYVTEEPESESECPSDDQIMQHVTSDVTELYRRKHQTVNHHRNSAGTYYHTHVPNCYEQQTRIPATCACNLPPLDPRYCYYKAVPQAQEGIFRSSTTVSPNLRTCQDTKAASTATFKKYPVTARTPRLGRYSGEGVRPRAVKVVLNNEDEVKAVVFNAKELKNHANYRNISLSMDKTPRQIAYYKQLQQELNDRTSKGETAPTPTEIQHYRGQEAAYAINDYVMRTTAVKRTDTRPVDSEGDVHSRLNDLENFLTRFDDQAEDDGDVEIAGVSEISKILKPKVPASVKAKHQDKIIKLRAVKTNVTETITTPEKVSKLEVTEAPEEPLNVLLQKLNKDSPKPKEAKSENEVKRESKFKTVMGKNRQFCIEQKPPLDDNSALELHKSKSYIVSLIDKALSRELGTVPGDKCTRKEFMTMNPKKAIDLVNRHRSASQGAEKSINLDVTQASSSKKDDQCVCKNEEPLYLKQLKQLRWSHLRHIQREAKRLADLERFLDSFSEGESPP
ncbi:hypothetical protein TcasGA2_TC012351 [Tribolium castaneum]|uniref:Uncharacterized protein n=1 Tax=Tribolium castaneum TaxID=7070 RepID=D6X1T7_TRICA|nr:hypothetical protein TcasGA2_TC012351 [Tribolium castaneum]